MDTAFTRILDLLRNSVNPSKPDLKTEITAEDLLLLLLPYLKQSQCSSLFSTCLDKTVIGSKEGGIQKRGYKILTKLVDGKLVEVDPTSTCPTISMATSYASTKRIKIRAS